ncbi:unnamed protein product [Anisakis simplex]|uniref:Metallophosphoesterase 1 homolog (inferred by orthology to a C. elegans protein) n=1 Tax=Anisakis simplex TaxID=6269 RepID=A0A0M3J1S8_ANISI|nr:unnamed protein product [Anisakis simplex]
MNRTILRESDHHCADEEDAAPEPLKSKDFREKWDCLSAESTELLLKTLKPRAVFAGHTHYGCKTWWPSPYSIWEWTIPSFSWRNTHQPALLLLSITPHQLNVNKCLLPNEINVICLYICVAFIVLLAACFKLFKCCSTNRVRKSYPTYQFVTVKND